MLDFMADFSEFVGAAMKHWIILWSGPLVSMTIAFWQWWSGKEIVPRWMLVILVAASIVLAFFFAWQEKTIELVTIKRDLTNSKNELQTAKEELNSLKKPLFTGEIHEIFTGHTPEMNAAQIFIHMSVRNGGAPSSLEGWRLNIKSAFVTLLNIRPTIIPDGFTLTSSTRKPIATFHKDHTIYEKAVKPIQRGGLETGWIRFVISEIPAEEIRKPGTRVTVTFRDIWGTQYEASRDMTGESDQPMYIPGSEQPFMPPPTKGKTK